MANEGIMSLPEGLAGMPEAQDAPQQPQKVSSADSYDAALTALNITDPQQFEMFKQQLRAELQGAEIPPDQLDTLIYILERLTETPQDYPEFARMAQADGLEVPDQFDPEFVGALLVVFNEMRNMVSENIQDVSALGPVVQGMEPAQFAEGGLADAAAYLQSRGRGGDTILAHITPGEAEMLRRLGGEGSINPETGLPEYGWLSKAWKKVTGAVKSVVKGVVNVVKKVVQSPIGRILATVALATVLGPAGVGLSLGTAAGVASAGTTLLAGGSIKDALVAGAMGYMGAGGTVMGVNPVAALGEYLPGAAGSALNTGLSTGVLSAGIGKLGGMSTADALKFGLTSGTTAAALAGLKDTSFGRTGEEQALRNDVFKRAMAGDQTAADMVRTGDYTGALKGPGQIGALSPTGTATDLMGGGQGLSVENSGIGMRVPGYGAADYSVAAGGTGAETNYSLSPAGYSSTGFQPPSYSPLDFSKAVGGLGKTTNYSLSPVQAGSAPAAPASFIDKAISGAKDFYNEYLSPSRPGLPEDAGILRKYGPLAAAGTAAIAAVGGMEGKPATEDPLFKSRYGGLDYMKDNPDMFKGGLDFGYVKPTNPQYPLVPESQFSTIPVTRAPSVLPMGATMSPAGVAQPYNVAGLYGVPLIYGQPPVGRARGGEMEMKEFPRRNGPIDGPGTGTSDSIPAMLSDGEFVFTAKAVRNAGGGSRRAGAKRMYALMKKLEGGPVKG
jgi:hypothetical protein